MSKWEQLLLLVAFFLFAAAGFFSGRDSVQLPMLLIDTAKAQDGAAWFECEPGYAVKPKGYHRDETTGIVAVTIPTCPASDQKRVR